MNEHRFHWSQYEVTESQVSKQYSRTTYFVYYKLHMEKKNYLSWSETISTSHANAIQNGKLWMNEYKLSTGTLKSRNYLTFYQSVFYLRDYKVSMQNII